jgi:methyl-accepting chemotaxis protein
LVVGAFTWSAQSTNQRDLEEIGARYVPAVVLGHRLLAQLESLTAAYKAAANSREPLFLDDADTSHARVKALLADHEYSSIGEKRRSELERSFAAFAAAGRAYAEAAIAGSEWKPKASEMVARQQELQRVLESSVQEDRSRLAAAFTDALGHLRRSNVVLFAVLLVSALSTLLLGLRLRHSITQPLQRLTDAAHRIADQQDLTATVEVGGGDELGDLAKNFGAMVSRLREVIGALRHSVASLDTAAAQMRGQATADTESWHRHASQVGELTRRTSLLAEAARVASDRGKSVLDAALRAESLGSQGKQAVDETRAGLEAIRTDVGGLVRQIDEVVTQTAVVGTVIGEVQEIAKQSNVVALNASIEAARAGEAGVAFAVVAREMRRLADESSRSTERIGRMLRDILAAARSLQDLSRESDQRIHASDDRVRASGASLTDLALLYAESGTAARAIVGAVSQQDTDISGVSDGLRGLDASMARSVESVNRLEASSTSLSAASQELAALLSRFKL